MTTTQGAQRRTTIQWPPHWYPIPLPLRYNATSNHGPVYGFGEVRKMSSREIIFAPAKGLSQGMTAEIAVAWPRLLDDRIRLQLVLEVTITSSHDSVAEARIWTYDFRTRRPADARQRTEPASTEGPAPASHCPMAAAHGSA